MSASTLSARANDAGGLVIVHLVRDGAKPPDHGEMSADPAGSSRSARIRAGADEAAVDLVAIDRKRLGA